MDHTQWATALVQAVVPSSIQQQLNLCTDSTSSHPSRPLVTILHLPAELIDAIAEDIEDLATLISLSSTCTLLRQHLYNGHIKPSHLNFSTDHAWVLSDLSQNPLAVSRLRHLILEASDERHCVERMNAGPDPNHSATPSDIEGLRRAVSLERVLIDNLRLMRSLRTLEFRDASPWLRDEFWDSIWRSCPRLRELDVAGHFYTSQAIPALRPDEAGQPDVERDEKELVKRVRPPIFGSSLSKVRHLRRFSFFAFHLFPRLTLDNQAWRRLDESLISQNPCLQELRLGKTTRTQVSTLFQKARWPELRVLTLINCEATSETTQSFLLSHPNLEILQLQSVPPRLDEPISLVGLPSGALPKLRHFAGSTTNAAALLKEPRVALECVAGIMLPLVRYGPDGREEEQDASTCLRNAPNLRELHMDVDWAEATRSTLLTIFSTFPTIRRLEIKTDSTSLENWLPSFALLQNLEALSFPLHQMHAPLSSLPEPGSKTLRFGGRGHTPSSFVGRIGDRVRLVAEAAKELEVVDFGTKGAAMTGLARVWRYKGSKEVDEVRMIGAGPGAGGLASALPSASSDQDLSASDQQQQQGGWQDSAREKKRQREREVESRAFRCAFWDCRAEKTMRAALCDPGGFD